MDSGSFKPHFLSFRFLGHISHTHRDRTSDIVYE
jgi:hypothetical protein